MRKREKDRRNKKGRTRTDVFVIKILKVKEKSIEKEKLDTKKYEG